MVVSEPVDVGEGYVLLNTDMLSELLSEGRRVFLPPVLIEEHELTNFYSVESLALLEETEESIDGAEIESVEFVGEMPVQCISLDDEEHLYLTDGWTVTHNTSNICFLKSTDDSMLDTLEKMSGKRHVVYRDSKNATRDLTKLVLRNEDKITVTMTVREEPVISYNDLAFLRERNSIIFRAGDSPIWNQRETILPMSWRLFLNNIKHPGHEYSLQTIPTLSSAIDFDVRQNQPDFEAMVEKRLAQAVFAPEAVKLYKEAYGITDDYSIEQLDQDVYADQVLDIVEAKIREREGKKSTEYVETVTSERQFGATMTKTETNTEQIQETRRRKAEQDKYDRKMYAGNTLSKSDLGQFDEGGRIQSISHAYDQTLIEIFVKHTSEFASDSNHFTIVNGCLKDAIGAMMYIVRDERAKADDMAVRQYSTTEGNRVYSESADSTRAAGMYSYRVTDMFYKFLMGQSTWGPLAGGVIETEMAAAMKDD